MRKQMIGLSVMALIAIVDQQVLVAQPPGSSGQVDDVRVDGEETEPGSCLFFVEAEADFVASVDPNEGAIDVFSRLVLGGETDGIGNMAVHGPYITTVSPGQSASWSLAADTENGPRDYWAHATLKLGLDPHWAYTDYQNESVSFEDACDPCGGGCGGCSCSCSCGGGCGCE